MRNNNQNDLTATSVATVAAVSATPFKTAFKAYLGIMAAQTIGFLFFVGIITTVIIVIKEL